MMNRYCFVFSLLIVMAVTGRAQVVLQPEKVVFGQIKQTPIYQFSSSVTLPLKDGKKKQTTAYLWLPPKSTVIKGVIITSQNVLEQWLVEHQAIRQVCEKQHLAILWSCPGFFADSKQADKSYNVQAITTLLDTLSILSGYTELKNIPWLPIGHSGTNVLVRDLLTTHASKIITAITMKGGPGFLSDSTVPVMCTAGEYFEWNQHKENLVHPFDTIQNYQSVLKDRMQKKQPLSYFFDPNTGHFDCSEALTKAIAQYIDAIMPLRLNKAGLLQPIDKSKGWIVGLPLPGGKPMPPKPYKTALNNELQYPWYASKQQAELAYNLANVNFKRKPQIAAFTQTDGKTPAGFYKGIVWPIPFETEDDGITFSLQPTFLKAIPDTFLHAGTKLEHNQHLPQIEVLCGNVRQISPYRFQIAPERSYKAGSTYLIIRQQGDSVFRTCIEPGQLVVEPNLVGDRQQIQFDSIPNVSLQKKRTIPLTAHATSGLPVKFFVKSGPAYVQNNQLHIAEIPIKAPFPIKVTVVAYQWGRKKIPQIQTAPFVERIFFINK